MHLERKILVVDGDIHLGMFLKRQLGHKNHQVDVKTSGKDADNEIRANRYDLLILELNLPDLDGMDLIKKIHAALPTLPILVLTARNKTEDIVRGLDEGAADYLTKPFSFQELVARIQVQLSRNHVTGAALVPMAGGLTIDMEGHQAFRDGRRIDLTHRECELLDYMMKNAGKALSRKTLMEDVWKVAYDPKTNIVDVYLNYLRDKIEIDGEPKLIHTIRNVGYVLRDASERMPCRSVEADPWRMSQATMAMSPTCAD